MKRLLVTTALEQTWGEGEPITFLGEWCKLYSRKHIWSDRDYSVICYHWRDRDKVSRDYVYLREVVEMLLPILGEQLNKIHNTDHSHRYWRILVGPWLMYFTQILFDRWEMLRSASQQDTRFYSMQIDTQLSLSVPIDFLEFQRFMVTDTWNHLIFCQLIKHRPEITLVDAPPSNFSPLNDLIESQNSDIPPKRGHWLSRVYKNIAVPLSRNTDCFLLQTYLPRLVNLQLQIALGQLPILWSPERPPKVNVEFSQRQWVLDTSNDDEFCRGLASLVPTHIPILYLEGFSMLGKKVNSLDWPDNPKVIFTSNSWSHDEVFKAWAAKKVQNGSKLVIGQHGGGHGSAKYYAIEEHQLEVSDMFLSWGWKSKENVKAISNFKCLNKTSSWDAKGAAILITVAYPRYSILLSSTPKASQYLHHFESQCCLVERLPSTIQKKLIVRLYSEDYGWNQETRWRDRFPHLEIMQPISPFISQLPKSRLTIHTYNSTTFLETLTLNVPTVIFFNPQIYELREEAQPFFSILLDAKIFHSNPTEAASFIEEIWADVGGWWHAAETQNARLAFCNEHSRSVSDPVNLLKTALTSVQNSIQPTERST